jgi:anti-sigma B factor antagonist
MASNGRCKTQVMTHDPLAELEAAGVMSPGATGRPPAPAGPGTPPERLALGEALGIAEVAELRGRLRLALDLGALRLDASEVEQVDAAGVQLLCAAVRDAGRQGRAITWLGVSPRLRAAAQQLGLTAELEI